MMNCDEAKLKEIIIEAIRDETGIAGVPVEVAEKRVLKKSKDVGMDCGLNQIRNLIRRLLDDWEIDKTIDELDVGRMKELGLPEVSGFTWHLKVLAPEKTEFYQSLKPKTKALIRLLREQNDPQRLGVMPKEEAIKLLTEQGFQNSLEFIFARDTIEDFATIWGGKSNVWCYGLVKEYEKTEEYIQWHEEMMEKAAEREAFRYRRSEEFEITDPICARLEQLAERREEDLERLSMKRRKMRKGDYLLKKTAIETRDEEEEKRWNEIIDAVYSLSFDDLIALQKLFLGKELPHFEEVRKFLGSVVKKDA